MELEILYVYFTRSERTEGCYVAKQTLTLVDYCPSVGMFILLRRFKIHQIVKISLARPVGYT
jgi:hypothetical protein